MCLNLAKTLEKKTKKQKNYDNLAQGIYQQLIWANPRIDLTLIPTGDPEEDSSYPAVSTDRGARKL